MGYSQKMMLVVMILGVLMVEEISAQNIPTCAAALVPCGDYLNSTKPPESCCKPLKDTIKTQRKCLCDLYQDPTILPGFGINVTQALMLPTYCGVKDSVNLCSKAEAPAPSSTTTTSPPPSGVPGGGGKNGATQMAWIGFSSIALFWAALLAY
ncbi:hypothetical protein C5167_048809 [Papaver somniferum]|uniref:Bifunctional inhibitor/plant lipid transfer protein/seed storage helical domain-containing protein n=1 Tax=Papaver somniferum TaxID=3469 RepID=A0A4Y7KMJ1_PAPSO|nr:lipid transfer-like protein VAS [Papaver somniferum]RZC73328.1 hypothetical protein C5167_048809 [Papaver somniferum]